MHLNPVFRSAFFFCFFVLLLLLIQTSLQLISQILFSSFNKFFLSFLSSSTRWCCRVAPGSWIPCWDLTALSTLPCSLSDSTTVWLTTHSCRYAHTQYFLLYRLKILCLQHGAFHTTFHLNIKITQ